MRNSRVDSGCPNDEIDRLLHRLEQLEAESRELEKKIAALPDAKADAIDEKALIAGADMARAASRGILGSS
jgi:hypothetical protein